MNTHNEYYAYLTLAGDFDPEEVSYRIGLRPTETWTPSVSQCLSVPLNQSLHERMIAPTPAPGAHLGFAQSRWSLASRLEPTASLDRHVLDVLDQLEPRKEEIRMLRLTVAGWIQLVAYSSMSFSGFGLDYTLLFALSQMRLGIDCVFYPQSERSN